MEETIRLLHWRNCLWLSLISYALYTLLWSLIDKNLQIGEIGWEGFIIDYTLCTLFTLFSMFYSYAIFRFTPERLQSYKLLVLYACILFLMNNGMAYLMKTLYDYIIGESTNTLQGVYTYSMVATFISCIYSSSFYLQAYLQAKEKKKEMEISYIKEHEVALQAQLNALKAQIDSHFMFNNFSILSDLIEEDSQAASQFLSRLSKVYRYVIQNMEKDVVRIFDEVRFLDSYLYLIRMRYGKTVVIHLDENIQSYDGYIPPVSLQLLVENAIKHNSHTPDQPLCINILLVDSYIEVRNLIVPLLSDADFSTSMQIGLKNLAERYLLLGDRTIIIQRQENIFLVKLPILKK